jgi:hypothetical protein
MTIYKRLTPTRPFPISNLASSVVIRARNVESVNMAGQDASEEESKVDEAVGANPGDLERCVRGC